MANSFKQIRTKDYFVESFRQQLMSAGFPILLFSYHIFEMPEGQPCMLFPDGTLVTQAIMMAYWMQLSDVLLMPVEIQ